MHDSAVNELISLQGHSPFSLPFFCVALGVMQ